MDVDDFSAFLGSDTEDVEKKIAKRTTTFASRTRPKSALTTRTRPAYASSNTADGDENNQAQATKSPLSTASPIGNSYARPSTASGPTRARNLTSATTDTTFSKSQEISSPNDSNKPFPLRSKYTSSTADIDSILQNDGIVAKEPSPPKPSTTLSTNAEESSSGSTLVYASRRARYKELMNAKKEGGTTALSNSDAHAPSNSLPVPISSSTQVHSNLTLSPIPANPSSQFAATQPLPSSLTSYLSSPALASPNQHTGNISTVHLSPSSLSATPSLTLLDHIPSASVLKEYENERSIAQAREHRLLALIKELESRIEQFELRKQKEIESALTLTQKRYEEERTHVSRLHEATVQQQLHAHDSEMKTIKMIHEREIANLQTQLNESLLLRSLASQVESSTQSLNALQQHMQADRSLSEKAVLEQIHAREISVREREDAVERERAQTAQMMTSIERAKLDHSTESKRLQEEHERLQSMASDMKAETTLLREAMQAERTMLQRERSQLATEKREWEIFKSTHSTEFETRDEMLRLKQQRAIEETSKRQEQWSAIMRQLDAEREDLAVERQMLDLQKRNFEEEKSYFHDQRLQFEKDRKELEERTSQVAMLGARVKEQLMVLRSAHENFLTDQEKFAKEQRQRVTLESLSPQVEHLNNLQNNIRKADSNMSIHNQSHHRRNSSMTSSGRIQSIPFGVMTEKPESNYNLYANAGDFKNKSQVLQINTSEEMRAIFHRWSDGI